MDVPQSLASLSVALAFNEGSTLGKPRYVGQTVSYDYAQLGYFNENDEMTKMAIKQATVTTTSAETFEANPQMLDISLEGSYINARIEVYSPLLDQSNYYKIRFNRV